MYVCVCVCVSHLSPCVQQAYGVKHICIALVLWVQVPHTRHLPAALADVTLYVYVVPTRDVSQRCAWTTHTHTHTHALMRHNKKPTLYTGVASKASVYVCLIAVALLPLAVCVCMCVSVCVFPCVCVCVCVSPLIMSRLHVGMNLGVMQG